MCSGSLLFSPTTSYPSSQSTHPCLSLYSRLRTPVLTQSQHRGRGREGLQQHRHKLLCPATAGRKTSSFALPCLPCALMHLPQKGAFVKEANKMIHENSAFAIIGLFCLSIGKILYSKQVQHPKSPFGACKKLLRLIRFS